MARRYDVDWGSRRLTLAQDGMPAEQGCQHAHWQVDAPMPSVPEWLESATHVWVNCQDLEAAWNALCTHTTPVPAAGGLLTNGAGQLLCIHRMGHWDLPKGKLEPGEKTEEAAAREVMEECGVPLPMVESPMATTHHVYGAQDEWMKVTHWFHMRLPNEGEAVNLVPQTEEGISEVRWASPQEVADMEPLAFGNIARLMAAWRANG